MNIYHIYNIPHLWKILESVWQYILFWFYFAWNLFRKESLSHQHNLKYKIDHIERRSTVTKRWNWSSLIPGFWNKLWFGVTTGILHHINFWSVLTRKESVIHRSLEITSQWTMPFLNETWKCQRNEVHPIR